MLCPYFKLNKLIQKNDELVISEVESTKPSIHQSGTIRRTLKKKYSKMNKLHLCLLLLNLKFINIVVVAEQTLKEAMILSAVTDSSGTTGRITIDIANTKQISSSCRVQILDCKPISGDNEQ